MDYEIFLKLRDIIETGACGGDSAGLLEAGYMDANGVTPKGIQAMEPYRVKRAVFTAAGIGSRAVPLTYDIPKGMIDVRGEYMIERQIAQLIEAGVEEIWMVTGHMHSGYQWLAGKYGVRFLSNTQYNSMNTIGSIYHARQLFDDNLYLLTVDIYLERNIFHRYEYRSWYAAPFAGGETEEWCLDLNEDGLITGVAIGGKDAHIMCGPVYMDAGFSKKLAELIPAYVADPAKHYMYWEHIYMEHMDEMPMYAYAMIDTSREFETLDELRQWDEHYVNDSGNRHLQAMAAALGVSESEIGNIKPLEHGLFTWRFAFHAGGEYLHFYYDDDVLPLVAEGESKEDMLALEVTGSYIVKAEGAERVSDDAVTMAALRAFHDAQSGGGKPSSLLQQLEESMPVMSAFRFILDEEDEALHDLPEGDLVRTHGAFCSANCIGHAGGILLAERAFGCMGDRLSDVGFYCAYDGKDLLPVLATYLGRQPDEAELERCRRYAAAGALALFTRYSQQSKAGIDCGGKPQIYLDLINKYS